MRKIPNTFGIDVTAARFLEYGSEDELRELIAAGQVVAPWLHIGGGSNITVAELAKELGISQSMLTNYENGNGTPRDESIWEKLSQIFGVSKSHVMGLTTDIETTQKTNRLKVVVDMSQPVSVHPKNQTELDILAKMDLLDDDDTEKLLCFINELLAKDKYEGRRESAIEYLAE